MDGEAPAGGASTVIGLSGAGETTLFNCARELHW
jgi:ABC-type branched-subunit amino acid transport system ATPase component